MKSPIQKEKRFILFYLTKYFYWLLVLLILIILLLFYIFIFQPQLSKGLTLRSFALRDNIQYLEVLEKQKSEVEKLLTDYQNLQRTSSTLMEDILPLEQEIPNLILQLDALTRQSGLILSSFSLSEPVSRGTEVQSEDSMVEGEKEATGSLARLNISLILKGGDYQALKRLVTAIESNLRLFDIISLTFNPASDSFNLSLRTYYYQQ